MTIHCFLRKPNIRAFRRRFRGMSKACLARRVSYDEVVGRVQSWFGHLLTTNGDALLLKTLRRLEDLKTAKDRWRGLRPRRRKRVKRHKKK